MMPTRPLLTITVIAVVGPARAEERDGLEDLEAYHPQVVAGALDAADSFATFGCSWSAKVCQRPFLAGVHGGAPSLACAVDDDGAGICWTMAAGGLFAGTLRHTRPVAGRDYVDVAVSRSQVCFRGSDGRLECRAYAWNASDDDWVFSPWVSNGRFEQIAAGGFGMCGARSDGEVVCWPDPSDCRNPAESTTPHPVELSCSARSGATPITGLPTTPVQQAPTQHRQLSTNLAGGCVIDGGERLHCWGKVGLPNAGEPTGARPAQQVGRVRDVSVTWSQACVATAKGRVMCWPAAGKNDGPRDIARVAEAENAGTVAVRGDLVCWIDAAAALHCKHGSAPPETVADSVAEVSLGEQLCVRHADGDVRCLTRPFLRSRREGRSTAVLGLTLGVGGGVGGLGGDARALSEIALRGRLHIGSMNHQGLQLRGVGPLLDVRMRDFDTFEVAGGLEAHLTSRRFHQLGISALFGQAWRDRYDDRFVGAGMTISAIGHEDPFPNLLRTWQHDFRLGLYAQVRYAYARRRAEVAVGLEVEPLWPVLKAAR